MSFYQTLAVMIFKGSEHSPITNILSGTSMRIALSIDDTDNAQSPGSGHIADLLKTQLQQNGLAALCSDISRHQLYVHDSIPYTSHNSSMCFTGVTDSKLLPQLIDYARGFLIRESAQGSDPGLCVTILNDGVNTDTLVDFGLRAKTSLLSKAEAYAIAATVGVHLSENGGTGDGVVGALAGVGLRLHGSDGRFRGWKDVGPSGLETRASQLRSHPKIEDVIDLHGSSIPDETSVIIADQKIKTINHNHLQVVPVKPITARHGKAWTTLTQAESKRF